MQNFDIKKRINKDFSVKESPLIKDLPSSLEAEKALLGAILLQPLLFEKAFDELKESDFYYQKHQIIFNAMHTIYSKQRVVDFVFVQDQLTKAEQWDYIGGIDYCMEIQQDISSVAFFDYYVTLIKEKRTLRDIIHASWNIINKCYREEQGELSEVIDYAEKVLFDISNNRTKQSFMQLDLWLKKTFQHLVTLQSSSHKGINGITSGYTLLDDMTSGFQNSDLCIIAARPSMGKTALALCMARNASIKGKVVGFLSLEMNAEQLVLRMLSFESKVRLSSIRSGRISSEEWIRLTSAAANLSSINIFIDDTPMQSILDIRTKARKLKAEKNVDIIFIDYLQLLHSSKKHENRHTEVSEISRSLKALAKELNIPIIALSQLSRNVESRMDKRPILSDLRESGAIEQDADLILFLYRDIVYNPETENPELSEVIIGKQRNGPTGIVNLIYNRDYTYFDNIN